MSKAAYLVEVSTDKPLRVYRSAAAARRKVRLYNKQCGKRAYKVELVGHYSQPDQLSEQS
jgi:hypothetical protein